MFINVHTNERARLIYDTDDNPSKCNYIVMSSDKKKNHSNYD